MRSCFQSYFSSKPRWQLPNLLFFSPLCTLFFVIRYNRQNLYIAVPLSRYESIMEKVEAPRMTPVPSTVFHNPSCVCPLASTQVAKVKVFVSSTKGKKIYQGKGQTSKSTGTEANTQPSQQEETDMDEITPYLCGTITICGYFRVKQTWTERELLTLQKGKGHACYADKFIFLGMDHFGIGKLF